MEEKVSDHPQVKALFEALEQHGLLQELAEVQSLVQYVGTMEDTLNEMTGTLRSLFKEVVRLHDKSIQGRCKKLVHKAENSISKVRNRIQQTKDWLFQSSVNALTAFRKMGEKGKDALADAVRAMKIPDVLDALASLCKLCAQDMSQSASRLTAVNTELQSAKGHLKNVGRLIIGKSRRDKASVNADKGILAALSRMLQTMENRYTALAQKALAVADKLRHARVKSNDALEDQVFAAMDAAIDKLRHARVQSMAEQLKAAKEHLPQVRNPNAAHLPNARGHRPLPR